MNNIRLTLFLVTLQLLQITSTNAGLFSWLTSKVKDVSSKAEALVMTVNTYNLDDHSIRADLVKNGLSIPVNATYTLYISENPSTGYTWQITDASRQKFANIFNVTEVFNTSSDKYC